MPSDPPSELERIRQNGVLRVGTLNNQISYYIGTEGPTGLDYELAQRFADYLDVNLEIQPSYALSGLFPALARKEVDLLAAGLTITPERMATFEPTPAYYFARQLLVYKKGQWRPRDLADLASRKEKIAVAAGSSHEQKLIEIQKKHPTLTWTSIPDADNDELLRLVATEKLDYTIADSMEVALIQRVYPEVTIALSLTEDEPIAWFINEENDNSLQALLIEFFGELQASGDLAQLEEKYFGHIERFDYVDTRAFVRSLKTKLPKWEALFKRHAGEFDWRLLAALSYQESHWNPTATSPTGVRGMMMLTNPTAKSVGVTNRLDPEQSIQGGAKYLQRMMKRIPDSIESHEKIWFALASYNIGFGHLMDARRLTKAQDGNPDQWSDVKARLPLLRKRQYHQHTRYGYARGDEAVHYVESIRRYYQSIQGYEQQIAAQLKNTSVEWVNGIKTLTPIPVKPNLNTQTDVPSKNDIPSLPTIAPLN